VEGQTAPAEQAEPQGSAAPDSAASAPDFGSLFKAHVFKEAPQVAPQSEASSADQETSAADEQPDPDASEGTPGPGTDGTGDDPEPEGTTDQPKLSRAQRKALKAQGSAARPDGTDTSTTEPEASSDADPVRRVERVLEERLGRLETLLATPNPSQTDQSLDAASQAYAEMFGPDEEFERRAQIAIRPSGNQFLSADEALQTERWATNREVKAQVDRQYRTNLSAIVSGKAQQYGIDAQRVLSAPTFDATYDAFFEAGKKAGATEGESKVAERIGKLEAANRQLADELEALRQRAPASARRAIVGGSPTSSAGALVDRSQLSGRELLLRGLQPRLQPARPAGRDR
jgi:hypothetical protein